MTICRIHRNNAEARIKSMAENNWYVVRSRPVVEQMEEGR